MCAKSLKFGDRQNQEDYPISTGVSCYPNRDSISGNEDEAVQHEIDIDDSINDEDDCVSSSDKEIDTLSAEDDGIAAPYVSEGNSNGTEVAHNNE